MDGRKIKHINRNWNKRRAHLQSILMKQGKYSSRLSERLTLKRKLHVEGELFGWRRDTDLQRRDSAHGNIQRQENQTRLIQVKKRQADKCRREWRGEYFAKKQAETRLRATVCRVFGQSFENKNSLGY